MILLVLHLNGTMTKDYLKENRCSLGEKLGKEAPGDRGVYSMLELDYQSFS